ncbi:hypothetical protein J3A66_002006 [Sphingomonas sp. PvP018]|jgi:hypothetical protein|nr:hypothetical protein [Sphingomonas sp. PvP018]
MSRSDTLKRRSRKEWAGRFALTSGIAVLAFQSVAFSIAQVATKTRPAFADALAPYDGRLSAAHAGTLITPKASARDLAEARKLSLDALHRDPTAVIAAVTLGLGTAADGNEAHARRLLAYAQMLSRRNDQIQLWSIEDAVAHGNVTTALRWYDVTLRTKPRMGDMLYPVLTQAAHDPAIRTVLVHTLAAKPLWADSYITYVAAQKNDLQNTSTFFLALGARGIAVPEPVRAAVVNALLDAGKVSEAWNYYATLRPGVDRSRARDPHFTASLETPSVFDWTPVNGVSIATSFQRTPNGGSFEFSAPASIGGVVLQQIQLLPPGTYRLAGRSSGIEQEARALPYWSLTCRGERQDFGRVTVPNSAQANGTFTGTISVPAGCPVQVLTLFVQPSDAISGISGQIDGIVLAPTKQR